MIFYYIAVSSSTNKRVQGRVEADDEAAARKRINKMGLALLTLSDTPIEENDPEAKYKREFYFEARDSSNVAQSGTIIAKSDIEAYSRLRDEFSFTVEAIYLPDATEEEKKRARTEGLTSIETLLALADEAKRQKKKETLSGALQDVVQRFEQRQKDDKAAKAAANIDENLLSSASEHIHSNALPVHKKLIVAFSSILMPEQGHTRKQAFTTMVHLLFARKVTKASEKARNELREAVHSVSFFSALVIIFEKICFTIAGLFTAYALIGLFVLSLPASSITPFFLGLTTGTLIPFIAFAGLTLGLSAHSYYLFKSNKCLGSLVATGCMAIFLTLLGVNVVY